MKIKRLAVPVLSVLTFQTFALKAMAANPPPDLDASKIASWINQILDAFIPFLTLAAFAMLVYGGIMYMMATGDPGKVKQAQGTITWAVIGLVFVLLMGLITKAVFDFVLS